MQVPAFYHTVAVKSNQLRVVKLHVQQTQPLNPRVKLEQSISRHEVPDLADQEHVKISTHTGTERQKGKWEGDKGTAESKRKVSKKGIFKTKTSQA